MNIYEKEVKSLAVKSKLPDADWVINPYIGCTHKCRYCYAVFMRRFSGYQEQWGDYIVVKQGKEIRSNKFQEGETILIGSVTDGYQPLEAKYRRTHAILQQLCGCEAKVEILTKSKLILDDLPLLKKFPNIKVGISINTLDDNFRRIMEPGASTINDRIQTLEQLRQENIPTYLFISPIFPEITDLERLVQATKGFVNEFYFENLNLRGEYKENVLKIVQVYAPHLTSLYQDIFLHGQTVYWADCEKRIDRLGEIYGISIKKYFYHEKIKKGKNKNDKTE